MPQIGSIEKVSSPNTKKQSKWEKIFIFFKFLSSESRKLFSLILEYIYFVFMYKEVKKTSVCVSLMGSRILRSQE